ncbi:hypothetical protein HPB48_021508 [Haemaphysalis longicornis]|uniref:Organic cation/carnitine transporter n=1 Tax=Haemaphysalis longicornis TaxID=44386 RepID=A0A9J6G9U0_HAELO|nr:hypothetical protein HPB48_021508 [Haemaphysalis longicornis]
MDLFYRHPPNNRNFLLSESFDCFDGFGHGNFQKRTLLICIVSVIVVSSHSYLQSVIARDVDHWCGRPPHSNMSAQAWKNEAIPLDADGQLSRCRQYEIPEETNNSRTIPCKYWEYDEDQAMTTLRSTWDLVCGRQELFRIALLTERVASVVFGVTAGSVSDRFGRMPILLAAVSVLLVSTMSSCFARSYPFYVVGRFFAQGSATATYLINGIMLFEVTTHGNRPIHVVLAGVVASVVFDLWVVMINAGRASWRVKQGIFISPTFLMLTTFFSPLESPRWLVAKGRLEEAEEVMLAAAELNSFPLQSAACVVEDLRKQVEKLPDFTLTETDSMLGGVSIRKRAVSAFALYFCIAYAVRVVLFLVVTRASYIVQWAAFAATVLCFPPMLHLLKTVPMLKYMRTCFAALGTLTCLLSLLIAAELVIISDAFLVAAKALATTVNIVFIVYTQELFPTAVRGTACGWILGFGALGSLCADFSVRLEDGKRIDVALAVAGSLLYASMLGRLGLPRNTTVECAKMTAKRASVYTRKMLEHMKRTLEKSGTSRSHATTSLGCKTPVSMND